MNARASALHRSLFFRLDALDRSIQDIRSRRTGGRTGVERALAVLSVYPQWIRAFVNKSIAKTTDEAVLVNLLGLLSQEIILKTDFVEEWFAEGSATQTPLSLVEAAERECLNLGLGRRAAVVAVGHAGNFGTLTKELDDYVFKNPRIAARPPAGVSKPRFAMIQVPRLEGGDGLWWPIVLGHELAHLAIERKKAVDGLALSTAIKWAAYPEVDRTKRGQFMEVAQNWANELLCDGYCVYRFGPAGAAAIAEFIDALGGTNSVSNRHPPGWLRYQMVRTWVGDLSGSATAAVVAHLDELVKLPAPILSPEYTRLMALLQKLSGKMWAIIKGWRAQPFDVTQSEKSVVSAIADLHRGVPPRSESVPEGQREEEVINAGWVEWTVGSEWPVNRLVGKALDNLAFLRHWKDSGGSDAVDKPGAMPKSGALAGPTILTKLASTGPDDLVVTPRLPYSVGTGSLDIRLGSQFIVLQRSETTSIRTFDPQWDPRRVQRRIEVGWGERFVLHPNELVLASTLEYVVMPGDLTAQVITRSSYGRTGLITATAVQVHPHFHGCLTLELLNLGLVPLELLPGERIAQLVFSTVDPPAPATRPQEHDCPVGPEFSRPHRTSGEARVFQAMIDAREAVPPRT